MPVTFLVATHIPQPVARRGTPLRLTEKLENQIVDAIISEGCPLDLSEYRYRSRASEPPEILASSVRDGNASKRGAQTPNAANGRSKIVEPGVVPSTSGFLEAVTSAYCHHHNLTISPDDVWIAILTQFNFYVNAHSEELRSHFVAHQGKQTIQLPPSAWPIGGPDAMERFAKAMSNEIQNRVRDPELSEWILPDFSTTTSKDKIVATVLMMATLRDYFRYMAGGCGIPEITIEGEKSDWENILARLDKLPSYGAEPTHWANLLRPILHRFISAFDGDIDTTFWSTIWDRESGSGFSSLTGWITGFCVWDHDGHWHGEEHAIRPERFPKQTPRGHEPRDLENLVIDGVVYPAMKMGQLPKGFASVKLGLAPAIGPVRPTLLMAGHLGTEVTGQNIKPHAAWLLVDPDPYR